MYVFLAENSIYVVLIIVVMIWTGIAFLLSRQEQRLQQVEKLHAQTQQRGGVS